MTGAPKVYQAIANITEAISKVGVAKSRSNQQQGYKFRGIDDIYNALAPELAKHKLCILPEVMERSFEERQTARGNAIFYVTVRVRFDFISAEDGSIHEVVTLGEAMDTADKATNKAMSAAYKYAAMMAFCIPTVGDDSETETHETRPKAPPPPPASNTRSIAPPHDPVTTDTSIPLSKLPLRDPITGELGGPCAVPLEATEKGYDFIMWGRRLIAAVKTSATLDEAKKWEHMNADAMKLASGSKALKSVVGAFESVFARFPAGDAADIVTEDDIGKVLGSA